MDSKAMQLALERPFPVNRLHWRVGATNFKSNQKKGIQKATKGVPLAYIDARDVMRRLDEVVGFANWQNRYTLSDGKTLVCEIGIFMKSKRIHKMSKISKDEFYGWLESTDPKDCYYKGVEVGEYESGSDEGCWIWRANGAGDTDVEAEKGKCSDAFKRAAVMWGIGRYLYSLPNVWLELNERGNGFAQTPTLPDWATPTGWDKVMEKRK